MEFRVIIGGCTRTVWLSKSTERKKKSHSHSRRRDAPTGRHYVRDPFALYDDRHNDSVVAAHGLQIYSDCHLHFNLKFLF